MPNPRIWRVAEALTELKHQVDDLWPKRSTASDGSIGDAAHATRDSDHNPWVIDPKGIGVVTAIDITDENASGCDGEDIAALIRASRDSRVKYIIFNGRICRSYPKGAVLAWEWTKYTGPNAHTKHVHVSVKPEQVHYDSRAAWVVSVR